MRFNTQLWCFVSVAYIHLYLFIYVEVHFQTTHDDDDREVWFN